MGVEEGFGDIASGDFKIVFSGKEKYCERIEFFF